MSVRDRSVCHNQLFHCPLKFAERITTPIETFGRCTRLCL